MRKDTQAVLLLLVGATLLKIVFTGTYVRYVRTGLAPLLVLAGAVLVTVAGVALWHALRRPRPVDVARQDGRGDAGRGDAGRGDADAHDGAHDVAHDAGAHGGGLNGGLGRGPNGGLNGGPNGGLGGWVGDGLGRHGEPRVGWLMLLPVLALLLLVPPALGSHQASRTGTGVSAWAEADLAPLPPADPVRMALRDYAARAVRDQGQSLAGRRVVLSGFVIAGPGGRPYLARMVVGCCAADARPVKIGLAGDVPPDLVADQWIEVEGAFTDQRDRDPVNRDIVPYLQVVELRSIGAPDHPYES